MHQIKFFWCADAISPTKNLQNSTIKMRFRVLTSGGLIFNGLLEDSDILKSAEEQDHLIVLIPDGGHLHVEPHRGS